MDIETSFIKGLNVCFNLVYLSKLWIFLFTFFNKSWSSQNSFDAQLTPELHGQGTRPGSVPAVASDVWLERPLFLLPADFMYVVCVGCFCFCFFYLVPFSVACLNVIAQNTNTNLLFQCKKDWIIGLWGMWKCKWHFPCKIRREFGFQNGDGKTLYKCGSQNVYFTGKER